MKPVVLQCDQIARFFLIFGHLQKWKFAQWHKMLTEGGSTFCPTFNKRSHNRLRLLKYCQMAKFGEIWSHCRWKKNEEPRLCRWLIRSGKKSLSKRNDFEIMRNSFVSPVVQRVPHFLFATFNIRCQYGRIIPKVVWSMAHAVGFLHNILKVNLLHRIK